MCGSPSSEFLWVNFSTTIQFRDVGKSRVNFPLILCEAGGVTASPAPAGPLTALTAAVPLPGAGRPAAGVMHMHAQTPARKGW